jgi:cytochrome c-type protein NapB
MSQEREHLGRLLAVALLTVVAAAVVGYFTGTRDSAYRSAEPAASAGRSPAESSDVPPAPTYPAVAGQVRQPSGAKANLRDLAAPPVQAAEEAALSGGPLTTRALRKRAANRAYQAAPPLIPHAVSPRAGANCATCHEKGIQVGEERAPKPSHEPYSNCTQCHIATSAPTGLASLDDDGEPVFNRFEGLPESQGERAWAGAPPVIPHSLHLREDCLKCHGESGTPGIRTSHPERTNCNQCHARQAGTVP